jgi:hypothetical protein
MRLWRNTNGFGWMRDQDVLWSSGSCQSLREIAERSRATLGSTVGRRTINERMNQIEPVAQHYHEHPIEDVPDGLQCDGMWLTLQEGNQTVESRSTPSCSQSTKGQTGGGLSGPWFLATSRQTRNCRLADRQGGGAYRMGSLAQATPHAWPDGREGTASRHTGWRWGSLSSS